MGAKNTKPKNQLPPFTKQTNTLKQIDKLIAQYYKRFGVIDYHNEHNHDGRFMQYIIDEELDDVDIPIFSELGDDMSPTDCVYVDFDVDNCPVSDNCNNINKRNLIFYILQHCYKYNSLPKDTVIIQMHINFIITCLRSIGSEDRGKCLKIMYKIMDNVLLSPNNRTYQRLTVTTLLNKFSNNQIWIELLLNAGFYRSNNSDYLLFNRVKLSQLEHVNNLVRKTFDQTPKKNIGSLTLDKINTMKNKLNDFITTDKHTKMNNKHNDKYQCTLCTFIQSADNITCEMCGNVLHPNTKEQSTDTYKCTKCTFIQPITNVYCEMCRNMLHPDTVIKRLNVSCPCGKPLMKVDDSSSLYNNKGARCDLCGNKSSKNVTFWHCEEKVNETHGKGYDACNDCITNLQRCQITNCVHIQRLLSVTKKYNDEQNEHKLNDRDILEITNDYFHLLDE
eukprot:493195_1